MGFAATMEGGGRGEIGVGKGIGEKKFIGYKIVHLRMIPCLKQRIENEESTSREKRKETHITNEKMNYSCRQECERDCIACNEIVI